MKLKLLLLFAILTALPTLYAGTITGTLQGPSGLPVKNGTLTFALQQAGLIVGTGAVAQLTAQCYTGTDGSVVGLPAPLALPIVATQTSGAGSLPAGIYYVEETFYNGAGETQTSPELQIQLASTGSLIVSIPTTFPVAATGVKVYIGTTRGGETLQGTFNQTFPATYTQSVPLAAGTAPPGVNSVPCVIAFNDTIIPYQGYNVSLTSSSGNAYPGWPQAWQINGGPNGTINVSSGAPLWNGTVIYPMPILSQPLNHGQQSISGPLDFGGYDVTNIGNLTAGTMNSVVNANLQPGSDIGAKITNALTACAQQCTIYIPAGAYSFSTPIVLPLVTFSNYNLIADQGAVLTYTGTGDMIQAPVSVTPNVSNWKISGGHWIGNAGATSGVHILPTNAASITGMLITGFTNGPGIWIDGANGVAIYDNTVQGNQIGVKLSPTFCNGATCGTGVTGSAFTPNNVNIQFNRITNNTQWGIISTDPVTAGLTGALNDVIFGNDLELNGSAGPTFGAVNFGRSHGLIIDSNYYEGSPREIVLGIPGGSDGNQFRFFASQGPQIVNNFFTDVIATPYDIELQDTADAQISGNTSNQVSQNSSNCSINTLANSGANIGETGTYVGKNHWEHYSGMGNLLCIAGSPVPTFIGAGSYSITNSNYQAYIADYNLLQANTSSETVALQFVNTGSQCWPVPFNSAAAANIASAYLTAGTASVTFFHTASTTARWSIECNNGPYN